MGYDKHAHIGGPISDVVWQMSNNIILLSTLMFMQVISNSQLY